MGRGGGTTQWSKRQLVEEELEPEEEQEFDPKGKEERDLKLEGGFESEVEEGLVPEVEEEVLYSQTGEAHDSKVELEFNP